ncbi:MAG: hypothetical protein SGBAC_011900 [Bacillariaceae sp.]
MTDETTNVPDGSLRVPQHSNVETSLDIPGASYHSVPFEHSGGSGGSSDLQGGEDTNRYRDDSPALQLLQDAFHGIPRESSESALTDNPGVTVQEPAVPSLSEGSFHGIPYEDSSPPSESDMADPTALSSFQEIPYEYDGLPGVPDGSSPNSSQDALPAVPYEPSTRNPATGTLPDEPMESESSV